MSSRKWGKAGERLDTAERDRRLSAIRSQRNQARQSRRKDDEVAYRLWRHGEVRPWCITMALNAKDLYGPEVDVACGAVEPDVDLWEAGKLYPRWEQLQKLAALTGVTPRFFTMVEPPVPFELTTARFHIPSSEWDVTAPVRQFVPDAVAVGVAGYPMEMPNV